MIKRIIFKKLFNNYTGGQTINELSKMINILKENKTYPIIDYIKEGVKNDPKIINEIVDEYQKIGELKEVNYMAIKLSSFNFDENIINKLIDNLVKKNKKIMIDAEEVNKQDKINEITNNLIKDFNKDNINIYKTYQMYRKDSIDVLENDINTINKLGIKLVRGAYYNQDKETGKLFKTKTETDLSYRKGMELIFNNIENNKFNKQVFICTHNKEDINRLVNYSEEEKNNNILNKIYHASLYGFIEKDTSKIINSGILTYKYLPYGKYEDSIPYLTRRIYENPKILIYFK